MIAELVVAIASSSAATAAINYVINRQKIITEGDKIKAETHNIISDTYNDLIKNLRDEVKELKDKIERMQKREEHYMINTNSLLADKADLLARIQKLEKINEGLHRQLKK